jgi:hypothetical protein
VVAVSNFRTSTSAASSARGGGLFRFGLGPAILFGAAWVIFWNEGGAAKTAARLSEGARSVVTIAADRVDPANEGKLVHLVGQTSTTETLTDPELGVSLRAIKLRRTVEMFQWQEIETREDGLPTPDGKPGAPITKLQHSKEWKGEWQNSALFKEPAGHVNPPAMLLPSADWQAEEVRIGAFALTPSQIAKLTPDQPVKLNGDTTGGMPQTALAQIELSPPNQGKLYRGDTQLLIRPDLAAVGKNNNRLTFQPAMSAPPVPPEDVVRTPVVGDVRVRFTANLPREFTLLGQQVGNQVKPYPTKVGGTIDRFLLGRHSADEIFTKDQAWSTRGTWFFRAVSLLIAYLGVAFTTGPLVRTLASTRIVPAWLTAGVFYVRVALTISLTAILVGAAWFYYRPLWAFGLLAAGSFLLVVAGWIFWRLKSRTKVGIAENRTPSP